jgi:peptidyl-prolyl cis-trans isomerase D
VLTGKTEENNPQLDDVKEAVTAEVIKQMKAETIIAKLKGNTIEEMASSYGTGAVVNTASGIAMNSTSIADIGYDPKTVGRVFGLSVGKQSKPFAAESGVAVLKLTNITPAPDTKDFSAQKQSLAQKGQSKGGYFINEAIKEISKVKDNRVKYF